MTQRGEFLAGVIVGALVGIGLGMLFAPQSGEQTRQRIRTRADEMGDRLRGSVSDLSTRLQSSAGEVGERVREKADDLVRRGRSAVEEGSRRLRDAYERRRGDNEQA